jgi:OFA family oxalate/formate antiporter-like MFS transporter
MVRLWRVIKQSHYGWIILIGVFFVFACDSISERLVPYIIPSMEAELNLSHGQMGNIVAGYFIAFAIMNPVWGILADRMGPRRCILIGQALIITGLCGMGFAQSFISLLFYILCGIGAAAQFIAAVALSSRWFVESRRGRANGILMSATGVTVLTLGFVAPVISSDLSWRWSLWIFAIVVTIISIFCWRLLVNNPEEKDLAPIGTNKEELSVSPGEDTKESLAKIEPKVTIKDIVKRRITWNLGGIFFVFGIGYMIFATFGVAYLQEMDWTAKEAARVFAIWGALSIPSALIWGILADRLTKKYVLLIMLAIQAMGMFIFLDGNPVARYAGASMTGFTYMGIFVTMASAIGDYYEPTVIGTAFGVITGIIGAGLAVGPAIGGHLADMSGTLNTAFLFGLGALVVSFLLTLVLKKPAKRPAYIPNNHEAWGGY